jgi:hypothetical protein
MRRFAPEVYDSGFRVKPGMTRVFLRVVDLALGGGVCRGNPYGVGFVGLPFPPVETGGYCWDVPTGHGFQMTEGRGQKTEKTGRLAP